MQTYNIHQAKTQLSRLLDEVAHGDEILIAKAGKPLAKIVPLETSNKRRQLGKLKGKYTIPSDFDQPLPKKIVELFEGK